MVVALFCFESLGRASEAKLCKGPRLLYEIYVAKTVGLQ